MTQGKDRHATDNRGEGRGCVSLSICMDVRSRLAEYRKAKNSAIAPSKEPDKNGQEHDNQKQGHGNLNQGKQEDGNLNQGKQEDGKQEDGNQENLSNQYGSLEHGNNHPTTKWWLICLKVVLWLLVWGFFIEVEFGVLYLVVSGLVFMVMSLRGSKKRAAGELSAYSVFNKNCEAIDGTLSAEQFERELRYGPTSVR